MMFIGKEMWVYIRLGFGFYSCTTREHDNDGRTKSDGFIWDECNEGSIQHAKTGVLVRST
jgi:hypothetical protein